MARTKKAKPAKRAAEEDAETAENTPDEMEQDEPKDAPVAPTSPVTPSKKRKRTTVEATASTPEKQTTTTSTTTTPRKKTPRKKKTYYDLVDVDEFEAKLKQKKEEEVKKSVEDLDKPLADVRRSSRVASKPKEEPEQIKMVLEGESEESSSDSSAEKPTKKRKTGTSTSKATAKPKTKRTRKAPSGEKKGTKAKREKKEKPKKVSKRATAVFEPTEEVLKAIAKLDDDTFTSKSAEVRTNGSMVMNSRETIRAVLQNKPELLEKVLLESKQVCNPFIERSVDNKYSGLAYAIQKNDLKMIRIILDYINSKRDDFHKARTQRQGQTNSLGTMGTGSYSKLSYGGRHVRKYNASRGGKEGNNALNLDAHFYTENSNDRDALLNAFRFKLNTDTIDLLLTDYPDARGYLGEQCFYIACEAGNLVPAAHLAEMATKYGGFGLNAVHVEALTLKGDKPFTKYRVNSATKKANCNAITPVHVATLNPSTRYLKELVDLVGYNIQDGNGRKPMHFAAAAESIAALKYLLDRGASPEEVDNEGLTPLMLASKYNRAEAAKLLLEVTKKSQDAHADDEAPEKGEDEEGDGEDEGDDDEGPKKRKTKKKADKGMMAVGYVNRKDKGGRTALHHACYYGATEVVKLLLANGADINFLNSKKETPLLSASMRGNLECVQQVVEAGVNIGKCDKFRKSALIHAVKNGHFEVARYLITKGSSPNARDSSNNSVAHYAAAYGWSNCLDLVVAAGADLNNLNDWKSTPLSIAMSKGHYKIADKILENESVSIDNKDSDGRTVLFSILETKNKQTYKSVKYLIAEKKADVKVADVQGITLLHLIATTPAKVDIKLARLLLENNADLNAETSKNLTPLQYAISARNIPMIEFLMRKGAKIDCDQYKSNILHTIFTNMNHEAEFIFKIINKYLHKRGEEGTQALSKLANYFNESGRTPLLTAIESFDGKSIVDLREYDADTKKEEDAQLAKGQLPAETPLVSKDDMQDIFDIGLQNQRKTAPAKRKIESDDESMGSGDESNGEEDEGHGDDEGGNDDDEDMPAAPASDNVPGEDLIVTEAQDDKEEQDADDSAHSSDEDFISDPDDAQTPRTVRITELRKKKYDTSDLISFLESFVESSKASLEQVVAKVPSKKDDEEAEKKRAREENEDNSDEEAEENDQASDDDDDNENQDNTEYRNNRIGQNAVHLILDKANIQLTLYLLHSKISCNVADAVGRTALHYAVSLAKNDQNKYTLVKVLLKYGANINAIDDQGKAPLHYAFVALEEPKRTRYGYYNRNNTNEPIEMCSDLVNIEGINLNIRDKKGRTALHYAAADGSTISSMYLIQRGADLNELDSNSNSPLGFAILNDHIDYAITLINKGANVKQMVTIMPEEENEKRNRGFGGRSKMAKRAKYFGAHQDDDEEKNKQPELLSMFRLVLRNNHLGLAYLLIDLGVDPTSAVDDALSTKQFNVVPTLISKTNRSLVNKSNAKKQNLFHIIANYPSHAAWTNRVAKMLLDRNVDVNQTDEDGKTPLHIACHQNHYSLVKFLLHNAVNPNLKDNKGLTPLFYVCSANNEKLAQALLESKAKVDVTIVDPQGKTALFYAICPTSYGSYENASLVELLVKSGSKLDVVDKNGNSPLFYSYLQASGKLTKKLQELGAKDAKNAQKKKAEKELENMKQLSHNVDKFIELDVKKDAQESRERLEKEFKESKGQKDKKVKILVDKRVKLKNAEVYETDGVHYDVLLQKTEIMFGASGYNNFYKMQVVWNKQQGLFVLLTRFGRIGETGNYQQTPFFTADDAVSEFEKIFKSKTGNKWQDRAAFEKKPNKYRLVTVDYNKVKPHQILKPIDLSVCLPSKLDPQVQGLMSLFCDISIMKKSMRGYGVASDINIGNLSTETVTKAYDVLKRIYEHIKQLNDHTNQMDVKLRREKFEELSELSGNFYSLIPHTKFLNCAVSPINEEKDVKEKMQLLENLTDFRIAARVLIASQNRLKEMSPLDYCYNAIKTTIHPIKPEDGEFQMISDYIAASSPKVKLVKLLRVVRQEEHDRFKKHETMTNRMLLWHGSGIANFISILNSGLKIAPSDAPSTGLMFGRGIYFADTFAKSLGYTRHYTTKGIACLLLCEVALGKMAELMQGEFLEKPKDDTSSTKGLGQNGPDFNSNLIRYDGVVVPSGPVIEYPRDKTAKEHPSLHYNEYIVYDESQVKISYIVQVKANDYE